MVWWRSRQPAPLLATNKDSDCNDEESSIGYNRPRSVFSGPIPPEMGGCPSTLTIPVAPAGRSSLPKAHIRPEIVQRRATALTIPTLLAPARSTLVKTPTRLEMNQRRATTFTIPASLTPGSRLLSKTSSMGPRHPYVLTIPSPLAGLSRASPPPHT